MTQTSPPRTKAISEPSLFQFGWLPSAVSFRRTFPSVASISQIPYVFPGRWPARSDRLLTKAITRFLGDQAGWTSSEAVARVRFLVPRPVQDVFQMSAARSLPFTTGRDRAADIWKTSWTGQGTRNLTRATASDDVQPAWSPRKRVIAFVSNRSDRAGHRPGKTYGIWLMDATDGKVLRKLTADGSHPNWKSDGSEIAFVRGGDVWVMNADGTAQKQLTHDPAVETNPAWSPDGHKIAFQVGD